MKFINKPKIITAEQFFPDEASWPINVVQIQNNYMVWNDVSEKYLAVLPGDWVRVDQPEDTYPIKDSSMKQNYEPYDES